MQTNTSLPNYSLSESALDTRARLAAKAVGLRARKSRRLSTDNCGEFQIIDPFHNRIVACEKFDLNTEAVIEYCRRL